jgi:peptide/nickel transport system substrate-binding protein
MKSKGLSRAVGILVVMIWIVGGSALGGRQVLASPARASGGTLTIGWSQAPDTLNPAQTGARSVGPVLANIFDTLVWLTPQGKVTPDLATRWTISNHGKTFTFFLRHGVKFQDGTPFNAAAVAANVTYLEDPATHSGQANISFGPFKSVKAIGTDKVVINLKSAYVPLLLRMAAPAASMQSPTAIAKYGKDLGLHPTGTGPFEFVSYTPNVSLVLKRNPNYNWAPPAVHHNGPASLDKVVFDYILTPEARTAALQSGQVQLINQTPGANFSALKKDPSLSTLAVPISGLGSFFPINAVRFPTNILAVRQALLYSIDKIGLIKLSEAGAYAPTWGPIQKGTLGYDPHLVGMYAYNPSKAASLLQSAGFKKSGGTWAKNGQKLAISINVIATSSEQLRQATAAQGYLQKQGWVVDIHSLDVSAWLAAALKFGATISPSIWSDVDPDGLSNWYLPKQYFNWCGYTNPTLTNLLTGADKQANLTKRAHMYWQAQQIIMNEALVMPIHQQVDLVVMSNKVKSVTWAASGDEYFYTTTLSP